LFRFRSHGKHIVAGLYRNIELLCRSHKVLVCIDHIGWGQLVAVPLEDSLDGEPSDLHTKRGIPAEQVARRTAERPRIGSSRSGEFTCEIEEPRSFGRCKPVAGVATRCSQIQEDLFRIAIRIFPAIVRNVARPVDEAFAVKAYLS
jgi:hypothetical protein